MCLYITGRYFWHLLGWSNRIKELTTCQFPWTLLVCSTNNIMLWFLFSRPSVQFSVTSINRSRRDVGLNWISCSDKKANSQFSWIVQEQPYRHHSAWKIRTTGIAIKSGSIFRWFMISFRIPPFGDSLFTNNPWLN